MKQLAERDSLDGSPPAPQILIIESDWIVRKRLKALLARCGYGVRAARSVQHVLAVFKHERPDLVIGDIRISDAAGVEVVEHIRSFDAHVPIIWLDPAFQSRGSTPETIQAHLPLEVGNDRLLDDVGRSLSPPRHPPSIRWPGSILVVDDEPKIRQVLHAFLELRGFTVTTAASGEEALHQLDQAAPRAIVLDISMPGMGGLAALRQITARHPGLPIIMITALEDEQHMDDALAIGAHDYLVKPFNLDHLEAMLLSRALLGEIAEP